MIIAFGSANNVEGHLVLGSVLSLIGSLGVCASYIMIVPWRKHPSMLILYRAITSLSFSINLLGNATNNSTLSAGLCRHFAVVTEMCLLSGEGWLTTIANDLVTSLTNPFISYKSNLRKYLVIITIWSSFIGLIFSLDPGCQGEFDQGICWMGVESSFSPCLWGYFLVWIIGMYVYQIWAVSFSYMRLQQGLEATFDVRKKCAEETFTCLFIYFIYLTIIVFFFTIVSGRSSPRPGTTAHNTSLFLLYIIANRGTVDAIVWFKLHDFTLSTAAVSDKSSGKNDTIDPEIAAVLHNDNDDSGDDEPSSNGKYKRLSTSIIDNLKLSKIEELGKEMRDEFTKTITDIADITIQDVDETDMSPQVNMALRKHIVSLVTRGVITAINTYTTTTSDDKLIDKMLDRAQIMKKDTALIEGMKYSHFLLDDEYPFKCFAPDTFRNLRQLEGIDDAKIIDVLSKPANERLSEGASGAFMFFCGGNEFIVKTIRAREARVLHKMLDEYYEYLCNHSNSLLCRFLGSYSLEMYDQTFYFCIMQNCFNPKAKINERFDIKGSWVGRSAEPSRASKKVVCRHCNTYFLPTASEQCTVIVGAHEADVVLKDNDLRSKIILNPLDAVKVRQILKSDSDLLGKFGVLDYSLLIGVRKMKYDVQDIEVDTAEVNSGEKASNIGINSTFHAKSLVGPAVYYLGIVDFLQDWTTMKVLERSFKIYVTRKDPDGLSVMPPMQYMQRFQKKMEQIFEIDDNISVATLSPQKSYSDFQYATIDSNRAYPDEEQPRSINNIYNSPFVDTKMSVNVNTDTVNSDEIEVDDVEEIN